MSSRQPVDLRQSVIDGLRIEAAAAFVESVLVAEVTVVRTASGHDDRVGTQIELTFDEIPPYRWNPYQAPDPRYVAALWLPGAEVGEKPRPRVLPGTEEYGVGVQRGLIRQRRDVQAAHRHIRTAAPVHVGDLVRPLRRRDIYLEHHEIWFVVQI